jgi:uncharacterized membrane protein YsdA (DUF1294 family)/cold shock CspA family protein
MRYEGILKSWNDERGFGFLEPLESHEDVFVHARAFRRGVERPQVGQAMSFEVEVGPEGKKRAKNVELIVEGRISTRRVSRRPPLKTLPGLLGRGRARLLAIPLFLILYLVLTVLWALPFFTVLVYVGVSLITFAVYMKDKSAAVQNARRTSELTLLALGLAGGWPGALLAQHYLRHKSIKLGFQIEFWCTVAMNIVALVFFCFSWAALTNP